MKNNNYEALHDFDADQGGGMIFSSMVAMIALAFLIGYMANTGAETIEREKMQHAADSVAYSSAVWLARGMNTTASINHVLGELTAYVVILEAFGGPETSFGPCKIEEEMNDALTNGVYETLSPCPYFEWDRELVQQVIEAFTDHDEHTAAAACYDAELTLKYYALLCLNIKAKATILYRIGELVMYVPIIGTAIGTGIIVAAKLIHGLASTELVIILAEYIRLSFLESAIIPVVSLLKLPLRTNICNITLRDANTVVDAFPRKNNITEAIKKTNEKIKEVYDFESFAVSPSDSFQPVVQTTAAAKLLPFLPVLAEPGPTKLNKSYDYLKGLDGQPWTSGGSKGSNPNPYSKLPPLPWKGTDENGAAKTITSILKEVDLALDPLLAAIRAAEALLGPFDSLPGPVKKAKRMIKQIAGLSVKKFEPGRYGYRDNPSVWSYPVETFDYNQEKITQWVRGTYPVVDSLRSGLRQRYSSWGTGLPFSNISTYLTAWSYRYTLSESYFLRSAAKRPYGTTNVPSPCSMYMISLSTAAKKGNEPWTDPWAVPIVGARLVEQMFTVIAAVESKPHAAVAADHFFKRSGEKRGNVTVAQAMFYSATARNATVDGTLNAKTNPPLTQPDTGWDTLQWRNTKIGEPPTIIAPEWSNGNPSKGPASWGLESIRSDKKTIDSARIQHNWQAMLSPVTKNRLETLAGEKDASNTIKKAADNAAKYKDLISH